MSAPQDVYDHFSQDLPAEHLLAPPLLHVIPKDADRKRAETGGGGVMLIAQSCHRAGAAFRAPSSHAAISPL